MREVSEARYHGNQEAMELAQKRVDCFTSQLDESNPILTAISDSMAEEGHCLARAKEATTMGRETEAKRWKEKMEAARQMKKSMNRRLMVCSAKYEAMMRSIRAYEEA